MDTVISVYMGTMIIQGTILLHGLIVEGGAVSPGSAADGGVQLSGWHNTETAALNVGEQSIYPAMTGDREAE